jgi:pilus assembly protein CpaE
LVYELSARLGAGRDVALVDLDLQFGAVADYLGSSGSGSVADLLQAGARLDKDLVRSVAKVTEGGIAVFSAPPEIMPIESVDVDQVLGMLTTMRRLYGGVVLDLPTNWTNWALSVVSASDLIVMVVELSLGSLRQAKRRLQLFDSVGIEPDRVVILVNRVEKKLFRSIDLSDVSDTLKREVMGVLTFEDQVLSSVQNQGLLVHQVHRKSKYHADVDKLAEQLLARLDFGGA